MKTRIDCITGGIYRISAMSPEAGITFNQFLIDDERHRRSKVERIVDPVQPRAHPLAGDRGPADDLALGLLGGGPARDPRFLRAARHRGRIGGPLRRRIGSLCGLSRRQCW